MFATAIIVFREALEAALIISIIAAATRSVPGRGRWIAAGLVAGLIGAGIVAATTDVIASLADGVGPELFNAIVLGIAVLMLAWHNIWMSVHGKQLAQQANQVGANIREGRSECSILLAVVGLAVLREGSETVLFLYGIAASGDVSSMLVGGAFGLLAAVVIGAVLYKGLLRVPMRWFFTATSTLVLLLAAGLASQAAKFLIQADMLPSLGDPLWDTSALISQHGVAGTLLHGLIGYDARPAGMQVLFYLTVLVAITVGMRYTQRNQKVLSQSKEVKEKFDHVQLAKSH